MSSGCGLYPRQECVFVCVCVWCVCVCVCVCVCALFPGMYIRRISYVVDKKEPCGCGVDCVGC